jgi:hypothetical protein
MYTKITTANPAHCRITKITAENAIKTYLILLFFQSNDLNLSEKRGNSDTSKYENMTVTANRKKRLFVRKFQSLNEMNANEQMKIALAGVGSPINESLCRVSILNFASRNAENTAMMYAANAIK